MLASFHARTFLNLNILPTRVCVSRVLPRQGNVRRDFPSCWDTSMAHSIAVALYFPPWCGTGLEPPVSRPVVGAVVSYPPPGRDTSEGVFETADGKEVLTVIMAATLLEVG